MQYLLVTEHDSDYGGTYEETEVYDSYEKVVERVSERRSDDYVGAYEYSRFISSADLFASVKMIDDAVAEARKLALSKLTIADKKVLGLI